MYLVYQPEGSEEPTRYKYLPRRLMSAEREMLERKTSRNYSQFTIDVVQGNSLCRRALLFMFQRREHPGIKWDDVDFSWDELELQYSRGELLEIREQQAESLSGDQLVAALAQIDKQLETAYDEEDEGKASLPIAG